MATLAQRLVAVVQAIGADMNARMRSAVYDADGDGVVDVAKSVAWSGVTGAPAVRETLTANLTYYVRTDGNDANNGLADSPAGAFKTIGKAAAKVAALDCGAFKATISVGAGTFNETVNLLPVLRTGTNPPTLRGQGAATIIGATSVNWPAVQVFAGAVWDVSDLGFANYGRAITATGSGAYVTASRLTCSAPGWASAVTFFASHGAVIRVSGSVAINAGVSCFAWATVGGLIDLQAASITLSGSPAFGRAFAAADSRGGVHAISCTFTGAATGKRYEATLGGGIVVGGAAVTYFPGSVAGTVATQGWYA